MNSSCFEPGAGFAACGLLAGALMLGAGLAQAERVSDRREPHAKLDSGLVGRLSQKSSRPVRLLIQPVAVPAHLKKMPASYPLRADRLRAQYSALSAERSAAQEKLVEWLDRQGIRYHAYTVVNAIAAEVTVAQMLTLADRSDVAFLADDVEIRNGLPASAAAAKDVCTITPGLPWGLLRVHADAVWAMGIRGQGAVVAGEDTGYRWNHSALVRQYRGSGATVDHNFNWHDAIRSALAPGANPCGLDLTVPCDDNGHGTHTLGTMVGETVNAVWTVGVAPEAKWIGCRSMDRTVGTPSTYLECLDWFLAPSDLSGANPDPAKAPHVLNNSWACPAAEGCTPANWGLLNTAIDNLTAAGILVVAAAGNSGSSCGSINAPPAVFENAFTVAWTNDTASNEINPGSSRGPVSIDGSNRAKPDIAAPGNLVCSTVPSGYSGTYSGTSMAAPHVAGVAALLIGAFPHLREDPPAIRQILRETATPLPQAQSCGGIPAFAHPNPIAGWGLVDAQLAYTSVLSQLGFKDGFE
jgi:serine protease AprX